MHGPTASTGAATTATAVTSGKLGSRLAWWAGLLAAELLIGIHVELTPMHLGEKFYVGVLFCLGNGLLFLSLLLLSQERFRGAGWLLGTAVCLGEFGGFIASRTVGLPEGYHETWAAGVEDYLGLTCLVLEFLFVAAAATALPAWWTSRKRDRLRPLTD